MGLLLWMVPIDFHWIILLSFPLESLIVMASWGYYRQWFSYFHFPCMESLIVMASWGYYCEWFPLSSSRSSYFHFLWNPLLSRHDGAITASGSCWLPLESLIVTAFWGYYFEWFLLTSTGISYCHFLWNLLGGVHWYHQGAGLLISGKVSAGNLRPAPIKGDVESATPYQRGLESTTTPIGRGLETKLWPTPPIREVWNLWPPP